MVKYLFANYKIILNEIKQEIKPPKIFKYKVQHT